jgi:hypothetical protein
MPTEDDGSRDPLLSDRASAVTSYRPAVDALGAAPTRRRCLAELIDAAMPRITSGGRRIRCLARRPTTPHELTALVARGTGDTLAARAFGTFRL